jgi:hypothetical protein
MSSGSISAISSVKLNKKDLQRPEVRNQVMHGQK